MLHRPNWPSPLPDEDFVRSFGHIRQRRRGGLSSWVGESEICEANRAIRFERPPPFTFPDYHTTLQLPIRIVFRRFYADGYSVCKYEIGFVIRPKKAERFALPPSEAEALLHHILQLAVTVPDPTSSDVRCPLWKARRPLAHLYQISSSAYPIEECDDAKWWVEAGRPALFLELTRNVEFPYPRKTVPTKSSGLGLDYYSLPWQGLRIPLWVVSKQTSRWISSSRRKKNQQASRVLRLTLLRLHGERECLKRVLANVADDRITVTPGSEASDKLQAYLNEATRRIGRLERPNYHHVDGIDQSLAYFADDFVQPGTRNVMLTKLRTIRRNILHNVEYYLAQQIFVELWQKQGGALDLGQLAAELALLQARLKTQAADLEHDDTIDAVASAQEAASQGSGPKALVHLAKASKWALDVATEIGVALAAAAIKSALPL